MDLTSPSFIPECPIKRPEGFPFPNVWSRFSGLKPTEDGKIPQFWIQDLSDEIFDHVLNVVCESFLKDAVLSKATKLYENPKAVQTVQFIWKAILSQHLSLGAFTTNEEEEKVFVGCNILMLEGGEDHLWSQLQDFEAPIEEILELLGYIEYHIDAKEKYNVNEYLGAIGLWVEPEFRGQGVGVELLKARKPLCATLGLRATVTLFTGIAAQKCAIKAGFELLFEELYTQYRNSKGATVFCKAEGKSFMYMGMKIEEDNKQSILQSKSGEASCNKN